MPIYEFKCTNDKCKNIDEKLLPMDSSWTDTCSKCGSESERIISAVSFSIPGFKNGQAITEDDI